MTDTLNKSKFEVALQRSAYGSVAIAVLLLVFVLDYSWAEDASLNDGPFARLFARGSLLPILFLVVILRGAMELVRLLRAASLHPFAGFAYLMIALLLLTPWLCAAGWLGSSPSDVEGLHWQMVWVLVSGVGVCIMVVARGTPIGALPDAGATLLLIIYLGFLGSFGVQLRSGLDVPGQEGVWLLLIVLCTTKGADIGAYFVGSAIGKTKLIPGISPGKSVEGLLGGWAASVGVACAFVYAVSLAITIGADEDTVLRIGAITHSFSLRHAPGDINPLLRAVLFGLAMAISGQIGDLVESCFKRDAGIKDSGKVMPHFGGILDMIDSPMLALPVAWLLLTVVWNVV